MNVEQRPDGWHITADTGEHFGPITSLFELEQLLDHLENLKHQPAPEATTPPPAKEPAIRPKFSTG
jgi:hypothetical protein